MAGGKPSFNKLNILTRNKRVMELNNQNNRSKKCDGIKFN